MNKEFNVIIEKDEEGFYVATVPALKGCHTQAKSLDELMERTKEAIELCLEVEKDIIYPYDFIGVQKITVKEKSAKYRSRQTLKKNK
jgi:predicted RNase H-like HicB family nuclease